MTGPPSQLPRHRVQPTPSSKAQGDPYYSRAVGKTFQLLEILARSTGPVPFTDLVREVRLTKSSVFRLLHTLESLHYIQRDQQGLYSIASEPRTALTIPTTRRLLDAAQAPMTELSLRFGETISLAVLMGNHMEVIHVIDSPHLIRMSNIPGRILPPHASSLGKAMVAHQSPEGRKLLLQSYGLNSFTRATITEERLLEKDFREIVSRGYATDAEESTPGGSCFAVPIRSEHGQVEAAMSISMPVSRLPSGQQRQSLIERLKQAGEAVSAAWPGAQAGGGKPGRRKQP